MTGPGPIDISQPASLKGLLGSLTPRGTDPGALMDALKSARRSPVIWCQHCQRPHAENAICPERAGQEGYSPQHGPDEPSAAPAGRASASPPPMPPDPFTPGSMADAATAEWFHGLVEAGIPVESVERIIGAMFAQLVLAREGDPGGE